jgi:hypothetical protein
MLRYQICHTRVVNETAVCRAIQYRLQIIPSGTRLVKIIDGDTQEVG